MRKRNINIRTERKTDRKRGTGIHIKRKDRKRGKYREIEE